MSIKVTFSGNFAVECEDDVKFKITGGKVSYYCHGPNREYSVDNSNFVSILGVVTMQVRFYFRAHYYLYFQIKQGQQLVNGKFS